MKIFFTSVAILLNCTLFVFSQRSAPADAGELSAITERGRMLESYDVAAWYSTDAVEALSPPAGSVTGYIARKNGEVWVVAYGKLSEKKDKYLISYEATQQSSPKEFKVEVFKQPKEDAGFYLNAAKAVELAKASFTPAEQRPYNVAVFPSRTGELYVYIVPAQTVNGIFPLGGDTRFTVSGDGTKIIDTRQLHKSIIEFQATKGAPPTSGFHTAVLDDVPEDTDVFHVLARDPKVPELVVSKKFVYLIAVDGSIRYLMTTEAFLKVGKPAH
jgi:hypothetical protein